MSIRRANSGLMRRETAARLLPTRRTPMIRTYFAFLTLLLVAPLISQAVDPSKEAKTVKPLKVLLFTGGCCHDYSKQKDILKEGLEARAHVIVDQAHNESKDTTCRFEQYKKPNWAEGYDVVIHDECSADVKEIDYVLNILNEHRRGVPAVNLHCAMHSYRVSKEFNKPSLKPGTQDAMWFDFIGLQSSGHVPQIPIELKIVAADHPILKGLTEWTTIREELYNNIQVFEGATPLLRGKQTMPTKNSTDTPKVEDKIVAWTNHYGERKTRVFSTTLGHNNETVGDDRYLNLIIRGLLWSCDKLNDNYLKAYTPAKPVAGPEPTPAKAK
jgi:type 1 glutamine amidotransferase